jgi:WD40 repeat protein
MPPEQARGDASDPRVDVYALGATLYHLLAGKAAFTDTRTPGQLDIARRGGAPRLAEVERAVARELSDIIAKAMAPDPRDRYADAGELAEELKRYTGGQLVAAHQYTTGEIVRRFARKHRAAVIATAAFLTLSSVVGVVSVRRVVVARDRAENLLAQNYMERGRAELLVGAPSRALVYLDEAMRRGLDNRELRQLIAQAALPTRTLVATFSGHRDPVASLAFSPDGERLVSASWDGTATIWNPRTGETVATLVGHEGPVTSARYSADGARVVTASCEESFDVVRCDRTARVWDAHDGRMLLVLPHDHAVRDARFSADGKTVLTISGRVATLWDAVTGERRFGLTGHARDVHGAALSPDGARVVTASLDGTARVWDAHDGALLLTLVGHEKEVESAAFSPDGKEIVTADWAGVARTWDAETGASKLVLHASRSALRSAVFMPSGLFILTTPMNEPVASLWEAQSGKPHVTMTSSEPLLSVDVASHGEILTTSEGGSLALWNEGEQTQIFDHERSGLRGGILSAESRLMAAIDGAQTIRVWRIDGVRRMGIRRVDHQDGSLVLGRDDDGLLVYDERAGAVVGRQKYDVVGQISTGIVDEASRRVLYVEDGRVWLWDLRSGELRKISEGLIYPVLAAMPGFERILVQSARYGISELFDRDGKPVAFDGSHLNGRAVMSSRGDLAATHRDEITLLKPDGTPGVSLEGEKGTPCQAVFSADGDLLLCSGRTLRVWRVSDGKLLFTSNPFDVTTQSMFSPDGRHIISVNSRSTLVWSVDGKLESSFSGNYTDAAMSHDGELLATQTREGEVRVLYRRTGTVIAVFHGMDIQFSDDDRYLMVGDYLHPLEVDRSSPAEIHRLAAATSWLLHDGVLLPRDGSRVASVSTR